MIFGRTQGRYNTGSAIGSAALIGIITLVLLSLLLAIGDGVISHFGYFFTDFFASFFSFLIALPLMLIALVISGAITKAGKQNQPM
ncbi:MAG TPA: hypothetical protein VGD98_17305 [Ktedonobacteraceae bacterium]